MPEMPEVEIIRRGLADRLRGRMVVSLEVSLPRLIKWPALDEFRARAVGRTIEDMARRGKYLLLCLDGGGVIVVHLRMTGRLCYLPRGEARDAYARLVFQLDNGDSLVYADTRTLGTLYALGEAELWRISGLQSMGPEPLSPEFTEVYLRDALAKCRGKVKSFLLNQKYIGGLGNIYADESLHLAKIHPERRGTELTAAEVQRLHAAVNRVIADGIADGGTTFRDYRDGDGGRGKHQDKLYVYGRSGLPCRFCGAPVERITVGGRGSHFCPCCQPRGDARCL